MSRVKLEDNSSEQSTGEKVGAGAYIRTGVITSIDDESNYPGKETKFYAKNGNARDLFLVIHFKTEEFERSLYLFGKYKRNSKGQITGWDSWNNNIQRLLYKLLGEQAEIDSDLSIPNDVLQKLIGKEFKYVNYISNQTYEKDGQTKNSYQVWNKIFAIEQPIEEIIEEWNTNIPWINDYAPEFLQQQNNRNESFNPTEFSNTTKNSPTTNDEDSII